MFPIGIPSTDPWDFENLSQFLTLIHRLNMEFIWAPVYSCTHWLRPCIPPPPHLGSYTRAPLVSQDRWHRFLPLSNFPDLIVYRLRVSPYYVFSARFLNLFRFHYPQPFLGKWKKSSIINVLIIWEVELTYRYIFTFKLTLRSQQPDNVPITFHLANLLSVKLILVAILLPVSLWNWWQHLPPVSLIPAVSLTPVEHMQPVP